MPGEPVAPVNIDLPSENFVAHHTGPLFVFPFHVGIGNHTSKGPVKSTSGFVLGLC